MLSKNYLITGGAGFIGSHLSELLLSQGHAVVAIDDLSTGRMENITHLLEEKFPASSPEHQDLSVVMQSAEKTKQLISAFLAFARKSPSGKEPTSIGEVLKDSLVFLAPAFCANTEIDRNIDPDCPAVMADRSQLQHAIVALCLDASRAMPDGGTLTITLKQAPPAEAGDPHNPSPAGPHACLCIEHDSHCDSASRSEDTPGLSVARAVMTGHGGRLEQDDKPGKRSACRLYFPAI